MTIWRLIYCISIVDNIQWIVVRSIGAQGRDSIQWIVVRLIGTHAEIVLEKRLKDWKNMRKVARKFISLIGVGVLILMMLPLLAVTSNAAGEYTQVEWIYIDQDISRQSGGGYEKFDTGVNVQNANSLEWEMIASDFVKNKDSGKDSSLVGYYGDSNKRSGYFYSSKNDGMKFYFAIGSTHLHDGTDAYVMLPDSGVCKLYGMFNKTDRKFAFGVNDDIRETTNWSEDIPNGNIKVVSANADYEYMSFRFYGLKIWVDGVLSSDLIPATDSEGLAGIYDRISGRFLGKGPYEYKPLDKEAPSEEHVHNFVWKIINHPTKDCEGLEGEVCSVCGAIGRTQPMSAYVCALEDYATPMITAAKPGQTITFDFGEWNSFPVSFMQKLKDKLSQNVTFIFKCKVNHKLQIIRIPAGTPIDTSCDWYGPDKMKELYASEE